MRNLLDKQKKQLGNMQGEIEYLHETCALYACVLQPHYQHTFRVCSDPIISLRAWTDVQMTSHTAFIPAILVSGFKSPPLPELAALQSVVLGLSLLYHRNYERQCLLASAEALCAKTLFVYGTVQIFYSPSDILLVANSMCFLLTAGIFIVTNLDKSLYECYHPIGLHMVVCVCVCVMEAGRCCVAMLSNCLSPPPPLSLSQLSGARNVVPSCITKPFVAVTAGMGCIFQLVLRMSSAMQTSLESNNPIISLRSEPRIMLHAEIVLGCID